MKKEEIMKNVSTTFSKVSVKLKKHSPEILIVACKCCYGLPCNN